MILFYLFRIACTHFSSWKILGKIKPYQSVVKNVCGKLKHELFPLKIYIILYFSVKNLKIIKIYLVYNLLSMHHPKTFASMSLYVYPKIS